MLGLILFALYCQIGACKCLVYCRFYCLRALSVLLEKRAVIYALLLLLVTPFVAYNQYFKIAVCKVPNTWLNGTLRSRLSENFSSSACWSGYCLYADWCVACQPIEHRILKKFSQLLRLTISLSLIWVIFTWGSTQAVEYFRATNLLNEHQQEIRSLRLTGAFSSCCNSLQAYRKLNS